MNNLKKLTNGGCFIAGTVIFTDEGKEEIEDIQVGDYVYARDQYGEEQDYKEVTRVFIREKNILVHLVINGETITTTEEHPFYIEEEGFVPASELEVGDLAETADGETVPVEAVEVEYLEEPVTVYNFEVEDYHTYYVGDTEVLVHNTCMVGGNGTKGVGNSEPITDPARLLEASKEVADHHLIPAFRGKSKPYADFIKQRGIDVNNFTITVSSGKGGQHMNFIHGKGKWNQKWMEFIDNNPNATAKDIYQFTGKMMDDYGLSGYPIHPYKK